MTSGQPGAPASGGGSRSPRQARGPQEFRSYARDRLIDSRLTPNAISITGFALNLAAAGLIVGRLFILAGLAFIIGSIMDTLDGRYSRMSGKGTLFGAFLDSTLDRLEEGIVLTAVAWHFAEHDGECKVGIATRPVRVVILSAGLVFADGELISGVDLLPASIYVMAALTAFTVVQRVWHVRGELAAASES